MLATPALAVSTPDLFPPELLIQAQTPDTCYTVTEALELMTKNGYKPAGVFPASDGILQGGVNDVIMYYFDDVFADWFAAEVIDGCVSTIGIPVPGWEPPSGK